MVFNSTSAEAITNASKENRKSYIAPYQSAVPPEASSVNVTDYKFLESGFIKLFMTLFTSAVLEVIVAVETALVVPWRFY